MSVIIKIAGVVAIVDGLQWRCSNKNLEHMLNRVEYDNLDPATDPDLRVAALAIEQFHAEMVKYDEPNNLRARAYESSGVAFRYCPGCQQFTTSHADPSGNVQCQRCGGGHPVSAAPAGSAPTQIIQGPPPVAILPTVIQANISLAQSDPDLKPRDAAEWRMVTAIHWILLCLCSVACLLPVRGILSSSSAGISATSKSLFLLFLVLLIPTGLLGIRLRRLYVSYHHALVPWYIPAIFILALSIFIVFV